MTEKQIKLFDGTKVVAYDHGLGVHSTSTIVDDKEGKGFEKFETVVGVDRNIGNNGASSVVFEVYVDGLKKYENGVMNYNKPSKIVSVNVAGAEEVKLAMTAAGNGDGSDHGDWANAKFLVLASPAVEVVALQVALDFATPIIDLSYVNPSKAASPYFIQ